MIRVKVEIVPHGVESRAEVIDEVLIENDGTGRATGPDEGGVGNYNVFDGETIEHLRCVDYPGMYALGRIEGVDRDPKHRLLLASRALGMAHEHAAERGGAL